MDIRRELSHIRKHYRHYQRNYGEAVVWFEFIPLASSASAGSLYDDVYDEGAPGAGGRTYRNGITVPVLMITEAEDQKRAIPEGRQPVQLTNFVASVEDFRDAGVSDPFEYQRHLNDMFLYDGRYFSVASYRVRGRAKDDVLIVVEGIEVYIDQELVNDPGPAPFSIQNDPWPSLLPSFPSDTL
jgi:hypothetical protein